MKKNRRPLAVVHARSIRQIGSYILRMRAIAVNLGNHSSIFNNPPVVLLTFILHIDNLEMAEALARTRIAGAVGDRDVKYDLVSKDVYELLAYVQSLADRAPDELAAITIIETSGFNVKRHGVHVKPPLAASNDKQVKGNVVLRAKAATGRAAYEWQHSDDGAVWSTLPTTLTANTVAKNLPPGLRYFRFRAVTREGATGWSGAVALGVDRV